MNFQEALKIVNKAIYEKEGRGLADPEVVVLKGSWENLTYEEMAEGLNYSANYLKGDMGHKFWKLLSEALGESVSKKNFKAALERARSRFLVEDATPTELEFPDYSQMQIKDSAAKGMSFLQLDESSKESDSPSESSSKTEKRKVWQIVLELDKLDDIEPIIKQLEKLGEGSMTVQRIEKGSIVLTVETDPEFCERINYLFNSGQLKEVSGIMLLYILRCFPEKLCLNFLPQELHAAWSLKSDYSNPRARRNAYLNKLCFNKLANWLSGNVYKSQNLDILPAIWEMVNGSAIQLGNRRLVLIPCEAANADELCVPQEWIDIPNWIGNYYLAVLVSGDSMRIWGYATHRQFKNEGTYDPHERTYSLSGDVLGKLSQIWEVPILDTKAAVEPLPSLSGGEIQTLLRQLGQASVDSPGLQIPFEKWGALLEDEHSREQLYKTRLAKGEITNKTLVKLGQWLDNIADTSWQTIEELMEGLGTVEANLAFGGVGGGDRFRDTAAASKKAIPGLVELLHGSTDKWTKLQAATLLGRVGGGNARAIAALTELVYQASDGDLRRQAGVSLGKIAPGNPRAAVRKGKIINLGMQLAGSQVVLIITLMPESNGKTNVHLRLSPVGQTDLPPSLQLAVLTEMGQTLLEARSRNTDNAIQLELRGDRDDAFAVKITLGEASVTEEFVI